MFVSHCHIHCSSLIYSVALHHVGEILVPSLACSLLLCLFSDPSCLALKILRAELHVTMSRPFCELLRYVARGHVLKAITGVKLLSGSPTLPACALCRTEPLLLYCSIYKRSIRMFFPILVRKHNGRSVDESCILQL